MRVINQTTLATEAYHQHFWGCRKEELKACVESARNKENLFDYWYSSKDINKEFAKLCQSMLIGGRNQVSDIKSILMKGRLMICIKQLFGQIITL